MLAALTITIRREDLAGVARVQLVAERDQATVDPSTDAGVADLGVHRVGEVDRRGGGRI